MMWNNITPNDRIIRFILGTLCVYGGIIYHPFLAIPAIALFWSITSNNCILYKILGINRKIEDENHFLNVLPKYNPEPVLIFSDHGMLLFRNDAAYKFLPNLTAYAQLNLATSPDHFISNEQEDVIRYVSGFKTYQLLLKSNGVDNFIMVYGFDISLIVEDEKALKTMALTDALTGLDNRKKLLLDLEVYPERILTLIDIKNFGQINAFYGHESGDRFLNAFATLLDEICHREEYKAYRIQSDVFAVLREGQKVPLEKINELFTEMYLRIDEIEFGLEVSMGHAKKSDGDRNVLTMAETALMEAKKRGLRSLEYAQLSGVNQRYLENLEWSKRIKHILAHDDDGVLTAYFQPIQNTQTGHIEKYETLARVVDQHNVFSPIYFLDSAKQLGLLPKITLEMARQALRNAQKSSAEFSINITTQDLQNDHFSHQLLTLLSEYNISPSRIVLELLEDEEIYDYLGVIKTLKADGFRLAIDDFGTGYSNFAKLQQINVNYIKIDGSLIKNIDVNPMHLEVVRTIVQFTHSIGAKSIAEFVSNGTIAELLTRENVDYLQGYEIGQPSSTLTH